MRYLEQLEDDMAENPTMTPRGLAAAHGHQAAASVPAASPLGQRQVRRPALGSADAHAARPPLLLLPAAAAAAAQSRVLRVLLLTTQDERSGSWQRSTGSPRSPVALAHQRGAPEGRSTDLLISK